MKSRRLAAVLTAAALLGPAAASAATLSHQDSSLLQRMNAVRAAHGLRPLSVDPRLERAARFHDGEMLSSGVFAHGAFATRMARFDVTGDVAGENLAWGTGARGSADGVVAAWLASPLHRANLLRPSFTRVGVADVSGSFGGQRAADVVTADFAG